MIFKSTSVENTGKIASELAQKILKRTATKEATVIALEGELGAGKTTFVKAFAKEMGIKNKITSPTFVILKKYMLNYSKYQNLIHIDAYRMNNSNELKALGIEEMYSYPENIILIEWPERVARMLPEKFIRIHIDHVSENERKLSIVG